MQAYEDFASVYDELMMDTTPYEEWCEFLDTFIKKYGVSKPQRNAKDVLTSEKNLVVDLGCGTGTLTELMAEAGFDMLGIDMSPEMLQEAMEKREESGHDIMYLCQDMRELEHYFIFSQYLRR